MARFTDKQKAFIDNYIKTLNGTEAARRAQYKGDDNTLAVVAHENLRKPKIREEIDRRLEEAGITDDEIEYRLAEQARGDIGDALRVDGNIVMVDIGKLKQAGKTHLIKKFSQTKRGIKIEFYDSQAALVHLAKLRGLSKGDGDTVEVNINIDEPRKRLASRISGIATRIGEREGDSGPVA